MKLHDYVKANGCKALAEQVGTSPAYMSQIANGHRRASGEMAIAIEKATNGAVRCEDIRPDIDWTVLRGTDRAA